MSENTSATRIDESALLAELGLRYGLPFTRIEFLRESGALCHVVWADGRRYLSRRVKPAFRETARMAVAILARLEKEDFPAPRVVPTVSGELEYTSGGTVNTLLEYIEGKEPKKGEGLRKFGETAGRLHAMTPPEGLRQRDEAYFFGRYLRQMEKKGYPEEKLAFFREYGAALWERLQDLPRGFCHGDMHRGNALIGEDGRAYLLDFDTACISYPAFDIAVFCDVTDYFRYREGTLEKTLRNAERFLVGYRKFRPLSPEEEASVPLWIAVRHFEVQATILELFGLDCVDEAFLDRQRGWLARFREETKELGYPC